MSYALTPPRYGCCEHCSDDPSYHEEEPANSHDTWCTIPGCNEGKRAYRGGMPGATSQGSETGDNHA